MAYSNSSIAIIIPAYNEAKNIPILLKRIYTTLPTSLVIVVDDSVPNQATTISNTIKKQFPLTTYLRRKTKSGRGSAVLLGMKEALKHKNVTHVFEMDADLAHDPADFKKFLAKKDQAGLIIGSRYMGRSMIKNWPLKRLVASKLVNAFLKVWLGLKLTDYTNGFRLYSRKAVSYLLKQPLRETGFISLSEVAYRLKQGKFTMAEVPITFTDRIYGVSSANTQEHLNAFRGMVRIRLAH